MSVSSSVKLLKCTKCSFTTYYNQSLKVHMYRKHELTLEEAKPFVCKLCGYRTNYRGNLQKHIRVHTGERPYRCNVCEKGFTTSSNLKMHMLRHHGQGPRPLTNLPSWPAPPAAAAGTMFPNQFLASSPDLMRQYYATLVGQAFAQQGALIPMMQQAAMMHHGLAQDMKTASANQVMGSSSSASNNDQDDDKEADRKPVVGLDVPATFGSDLTPEREPDSCGTNNDLNIDNNKSQDEDKTFDNLSHESSSPDDFDQAFPSSSQDNSPIKIAPTKEAKKNNKRPRNDEDTHDIEMKLEFEPSDDNHPCNKSPGIIQEEDERRTSTSSVVTGVSLHSLEGAAPGDLDLSRSSERSTEKRSDDLTTSLLDDLVQKGQLYSCQYCNIYFPELSMYVFHKGCHGPDAPFQCNFCYETFNKFDFMAHFLFCVHSNRK